MKNTISIRKHISLDDIKDLLCGCATGSSYWASSDLGYQSGMDDAVSEKGTEIQDIEASDDINPKLYMLDIKKIKRGLTVFAKKYPKAFVNFICEDYDELTSDVFLQCCLFGEVIYS